MKISLNLTEKDVKRILAQHLIKSYPEIDIDDVKVNIGTYEYSGDFYAIIEVYQED